MSEKVKKPKIQKRATGSSTKKVGGGTKKNPVSAERLKAAEDSIKNKVVKSKSPYSQATIDLKQRAADAKKRAQEKILNKSFVSDPVDPLERLADRFERSTNRWELIVYPSMIAFVLLAGYGFFLIYHLTHDISVLTKNITEMTRVVSATMPKMSQNVAAMSHGITRMSDQMIPMNANLASMNRSVYGMHRDVGNMNRTVSSGPFGMMNDFMPFSSNSYRGPMAPPSGYVPPSVASPSNIIVKPQSSVQTPWYRAPTAIVVNNN